MNKKLFSIFIIPLVILITSSGILMNEIQNGGIKEMGPEPTIVWFPEKVEINIFPGTVKGVNVSFISNKDLKNVKFWVIPFLLSAKRFISIEPESFGDIIAGEENSVQIIVSVPSGTRLSKYSAMVFVASERITPLINHKFSKPHLRFLRIIVNVVEPSVEEIPETISLPGEDRIYEDPETKAIFIKDEIVVGFKEGTSEETMKNVVSEIGGVFLGSNEELNLYQIQVPITSLNELNPLIEQLKTEESIKVAFHHWISSIEKTPNDPDFDSDTWDEENPADKNWPQELIKLPSGWDIETGTVITKVAVIDNGFDFQHEDLKENIFLTGKTNFVRNHGTHVAGILGARGNNNKGVAGTMWETGLFLYSAGLEDERLISSVAAAVGMKNAIENGARVINFSAGGYYKKTEDLKEANNFWKQYVIERTKKKGKDVLFVFAAGNDGKDHINHSPSSLSLEYDNVISVAAVDINGDLANYSNFGEVTVAAPGGDGLPLDEGDVYNTLPSNTYGYKGGTSMATPFASGLAGLIYSEAQEKEINLTAAKVKEYIVNGAEFGGKKIPNQPFYVINTYESLKLLISPVIDSGWLTFQHDAQHTGRSPITGSQTNNLKWTFNLDPLDLVYTSQPPVIDNEENIYQAYSRSDGSGGIYAINKNGNLLWNFITNDGGATYPTISPNGVIYVNVGSWIYAVDLEDGTLNWKILLDRGISMSSPILSSDGTIYVAGFNFYAISSEGSIKWTISTPERFGFTMSFPVLGYDGTIYARVTNLYPDEGKLYAMNSDGSIKWIYSDNIPIASFAFPVISQNGIIYLITSTLDIPQNFRINAINTDGSLKWTSNDIEGWIKSPALAPDGSLYLPISLSLIMDFDLYKIETIDGSLKKVNLAEKIRLTPIIDNDGTLYLSTVSNKFIAINPDGTLKWSYDNISITNFPAMGPSGTIYAYSYLDRILYAFGE